MSMRDAVKSAIETMAIAAVLERHGCHVISARSINRPHIIVAPPRSSRSLFDYRKTNGIPTNINGVRIEWRAK